MPAYHPGPELLMDYASGALPEPVSLLVATHVSLCRGCQAEVARLEALGGVLFDELDGEPLGAGALDRALARLELPESLEAAPAAKPKGDRSLPRPLGDYLEGDLESLPWKNRGSVAEVELLSGHSGIRTRLLRIKAGTALPQHTHEGTEYTLLLAGGFSDAEAHYQRRGDVAVADTSVDHRPVADAGEDCLCLAVTDAPLRLTGPVARYFNFLARL
ncbi:MAG: ChrR family anti-sigma-E factor [Kiloniellaceae bacterium]